jgi:D-glycero-alpha-D-manno-heptose-7-phosphate kinase
MAAELIYASAPTRIDFGGGWTDVPPFPQERGGYVCNMAIEQRAYVTLEDRGDRYVPPSADPLIAAHLRTAGNPAVKLSVVSDFPVGAGLGGSSAASVAMAAALSAHKGRAPDPQSLAELSRLVEVEELGIAGGRQDHYAAAIGGALGLSFTDKVRVERIAIPETMRVQMEQRMALVYTGVSRLSADTINVVLREYRQRVPRVVTALERMAVLAKQMGDALRGGRLDTLAGLVDEHWRFQRSLHPTITTPRIEALEAAVRRQGGRGVKALGASGGGCVILFDCPDVNAVVASMGPPLAKVIPWRLAQQGVLVGRQGTGRR